MHECVMVDVVQVGGAAVVGCGASSRQLTSYLSAASSATSDGQPRLTIINANGWVYDGRAGVADRGVVGGLRRTIDPDRRHSWLRRAVLDRAVRAAAAATAAPARRAAPPSSSSAKLRLH